jgi:ABC-type transport system involved in multi-copper enzyme maturation permease subunit
MSLGVSAGTIARIAANVFKESVRDKVLYSVVLFAILLISASYILGELSAGQEIKIVKDLGLAAISLFGHFIAIFIGIGLVSKEMERRSIYALLAKPMSRTELVLGKFVGLVATLTVNVLVMSAALFIVLAISDAITDPFFKKAWEAPAVDPALLTATGLILVQLAVVTAIAIFFSTFTSPVLAAAFTVGLVIVGHFGADLKNFEQIVDSQPVAWMARGLYYVLPNLAPFDVKLQVVHGQPVAASYVAMTTGYGALYVATLLTLASLFFSRRDFK